MRAGTFDGNEQEAYQIERQQLSGTRAIGNGTHIQPVGARSCPVPLQRRYATARTVFPGPGRAVPRRTGQQHQGTADASVKDLRGLYLSPARNTIISDALDVHISVEGLIRDMQQSALFNRLVSTLWAAKGRRKTSERNRQSSAENGRKGDRPRKVAASIQATR
jgi:hypothetical protein